MEEQQLEDQLGHMFNNSQMMLDAALRICRQQWGIEVGGRHVSNVSETNSRLGKVSKALAPAIKLPANAPECTRTRVPVYTYP